MKSFHKLIALGATAMLLGSTQGLAADSCADTGGYCYEDCRRAPCIAPMIALFTVAVVAIVAVAVQNTGHGSSHCHD